VDIAAQIATACKHPLLQSQKSQPVQPSSTDADKIEKPEITEYITKDRTLRSADGTVESNVDAVVYCTGYFYSYPFLSSLTTPVITSGEYVENLYQHIFYRPQPTLAFATLNQKIIPFPVAEAQSAVIARVWSGRLNLPVETEMEHWERETLEETGGGRNFHVLKFPKDADYINMLHDWAMSADQPGSHPEIHRRRMSSTASVTPKPDPGIMSSGIGKESPYWGEKEYWTRERFPAIKKAFQSHGEERHSKRSLEDVGFDYEQWKREKIDEAKRML
jgi:cation diffusion facilitator CzcD-associated flavoprotein CzcO